MSIPELYMQLAHECDYGAFCIRAYYEDQFRDGDYKVTQKSIIELRNKIKRILLKLEGLLKQNEELQELLEDPDENEDEIDEFYLPQYFIVREFVILLKTTKWFGNFDKLRAVEIVIKRGCQ